MDVRRWGLGQIMQLPDHCFGERFVVGVHGEGLNEVPAYDICELGLPDVFVLWVIKPFSVGVPGASFYVTLALGDQVPPNAAAFDRCELLFPAIESRLGNRGEILLPTNVGGHQIFCRRAIRAQGRRIVARFTHYGTASGYMTTLLTVSGIPTEVPDCLLSV